MNRVGCVFAFGAHALRSFVGVKLTRLMFGVERCDGGGDGELSASVEARGIGGGYGAP